MLLSRSTTYQKKKKTTMNRELKLTLHRMVLGVTTSLFPEVNPVECVCDSCKQLNSCMNVK